MIIEGNSVAECWLGALNQVVTNSGREISPITISINNSGSEPEYKEPLEADINNYLAKEGKPLIETTAGTIFPLSLSGGDGCVFERFNKIWKYVKKDPLNNKGTYFNRLVSFRGTNGSSINQLKHIINLYTGSEGPKIHRRSALIATVFDPAIDHKAVPMLGFPCLQQVSFVPTGEGLIMNAVYAMQHLETRAYGNYLGLLRLGEFMGQSMGLNFIKLNCSISVLGLSGMTKKNAKVIVDKYFDEKRIDN